MVVCGVWRIRCRIRTYIWRIIFIKKNTFDWLGDLITRFSGFTIGCITTGVIWITKPESFIDVILYDNLHVFLWVGGLFFALRGSKN